MKRQPRHHWTFTVTVSNKVDFTWQQVKELIVLAIRGFGLQVEDCEVKSEGYGKYER